PAASSRSRMRHWPRYGRQWISRQPPGPSDAGRGTPQPDTPTPTCDARATANAQPRMTTQAIASGIAPRSVTPWRCLRCTCEATCRGVLPGCHSATGTLGFADARVELARPAQGCQEGRMLMTREMTTTRTPREMVD